MFALLFGSDTVPPIFLKCRSSKTFIIVTVSTALFTDIFLYAIVVPVLPFALTTRVNIEPDRVQFWISIFLAVFGAALLVAAPVFGWLADRTRSRRGPLLAGLLALAGSTALLFVGNSIAVLALGRALQGISGAMVWVVGLALLVDTVGPDAVGVVMGYVSLSISLALLVGPLLGGIVFANAGYYAVFAMAFGLLALDVLLRLALVEKKVAAKWIPADLVIEMKPSTPGLEKPPGTLHDHEEPSSPAMPDADQIRPASDLVTAEPGPPDAQCRQNHERDATAALPDDTSSPKKRLIRNLPPFVFLFSSRRILSALWASLVQSALMTSFDTILPLYVRDIFNWTSIGAGLIFLPVVLASCVGPIVGSATDKYGPRWFTMAGFLLSCPVLILLRLVNHDSIEQKVLLCAFLFLIGIGLTLALTPLIAEIAYAVDDKAKRRAPGYFGTNGAYAQAYSLFNMAWAAGSMVGPLLAGLIKQSYGWGTTTLILGLLSGVTAIPVAIWTGGSIFKARRSRQQEGE